ncbi:MAG: hypothetical protein COT74_04525 [Bdellovibrionales bacterium CG10_big_fil_rev_8_21_14_0_10_45_34]|nr:MAG: hypothetical protein COT74_04525 [Bdellovibrionales bacterium CG10_big_fil_rev_8_21_14_0_10_45_34]
MKILVQEIKTEWTKASRSGRAAQLRSQTPLKLEMPQTIFASADYIIVHKLEFKEENNFECQAVEGHLSDPFSNGSELFGAVELRPGDNGNIQLKFRWSNEVGAPERKSRNIGNISDGEWFQVIYNGRFGGRHDWLYRQMVVNVGLSSQIEPTFFLLKDPKVTCDERALLR